MGHPHGLALSPTLPAFRSFAWLAWRGGAEAGFKLCGSSRANHLDRIASALEPERAKQFQIGHYLNPMRGAETSHFFRVEISIPGTDNVGVSCDDKPTVNSQDELAVATSGSHNLRRRSNG